MQAAPQCCMLPGLSLLGAGTTTGLFYTAWHPRPQSELSLWGLVPRTSPGHTWLREASSLCRSLLSKAHMNPPLLTSPNGPVSTRSMERVPNDNPSPLLPSTLGNSPNLSLFPSDLQRLAPLPTFAQHLRHSRPLPLLSWEPTPSHADFFYKGSEAPGRLSPTPASGHRIAGLSPACTSVLLELSHAQHQPSLVPLLLAVLRQTPMCCSRGAGKKLARCSGCLLNYGRNLIFYQPGLNAFPLLSLFSRPPGPC